MFLLSLVRGKIILNVLCAYLFLVLFVVLLSGGNRRKLSTAIALVGNPPIVFLVSTYNTFPKGWPLVHFKRFDYGRHLKIRCKMKKPQAVTVISFVASDFDLLSDWSSHN